MTWSCTTQPASNGEVEESKPATLTYLALGDSYTIGESVPYVLNFPSQLSDTLERHYSVIIELDIIATTGWTTSNLLDAIEEVPKSPSRDLVTLLIGVNNQYQGKSFDLYEREFVELLDEAVAYAGNDLKKVIVVSIPDYAFTPFGQTRPDPGTISEELDRYNKYARMICDRRGVGYVHITDITRNGLNQKDLVASDELHPSAEAYKLFVERIFPLVNLSD